MLQELIIRYPSIGSDMTVAERSSHSLLTRYDLYAIVYLFTVLVFGMTFTWITLRLIPSPANVQLFKVFLLTS